MSYVRPDHVLVYGLLAQDVAATAHFYRDVVGLRLLPHHGHRPALELGAGSYLVIIEGEPPFAQEPEEAPFPLVAFAVKDLDQAVEHLQAHGVELPWGIESSTQERWVKFFDPAGNLIEFAQHKGTGHR